MEKTKMFVREVNGLAIFSFLIAIFALVYTFIGHKCGTNFGNLIGIGAVFIGIMALIQIKTKKKTGKWFAILGIILGLLSAGLVGMC